MITFTADQPKHAATLNTAMIAAPTQPKEKREIVICLRPSLGPRVEKNATGSTPRALKITMTATLSQNPSPKTGIASPPKETVESTKLADSHMVKLSRMRVWTRTLGETRSMPCVSTPCSSGISTTSVITTSFYATVLPPYRHD